MPTSSHTIFSFSATEPTPLLKDFESFCHYVEHNAFTLGKASGLLPYKPLAELNELMTNPQTGNTPRTPQEYYPLLHLFYHLALAGKLFHKAPYRNQTRLQVTPRLAGYRALTPAEKYFFLLETLWMDCSLADLSGRRDSFSITTTLQAFLERLCRLQPNEPWDQTDPSLVIISFDIRPPVLHSFSFFGWYHLEWKEASRRHGSLKRFFPVARLVPTQLGLTLAKILLQHRPLEEWNLPNLRSEGFLPNMPETRAIAGTNFIELFRPLCAKDELRNTLPREIPQTTHGNFIFKVSVAPKIWRVLALSSKHTLDDLHHAIQRAFKFDDDHLYAFYMDNKWHSEDRFESPHGGEGPFADEAELGELGLTAHQTFLYHFDFGDDWRFEVQLLEIKTEEKLLKQPSLLETHGKAPKQYPNEERDW